MNIKLTENYKLKSDKNNVMIIKTQNNREFVEGYFSDVESAIQEFIHLKIRLSEAKTIQCLINEIKELSTALNSALHPLKIEIKQNDKQNT